MQTETQAVTEVAREYYNSQDADSFYFEVWGGEDIHIGLYDDMDRSIRDASRRTVERMAQLAGPIDDRTSILDIGAGYGGAARFLARAYGCSVACLNLSEVQNRRNRTINEEAGLQDRLRVIDGSFETIPEPDRSFSLVWCQDAILHSGDKARVISEIARVLIPGGRLVFTDPMQSDDCPPGVLDRVLDRIHLDSMGSVAQYRALAQASGLREVIVEAHPDQLIRHYKAVQEELRNRYVELSGKVSSEYMDRMDAGLQAWIDAGEQGYLNWAIMLFERI